MAELPDYIPEAVAAEYARLSAEWGLYPEKAARLHRLIHRPCMAKVYKSLAARLSTPEAWQAFFAAAFIQTVVPENWKTTFKPAREKFARQRGRAIKAGRELLAALRAMQEGEHGFRPPRELRSIHDLLSLPEGPIIEARKKRNRARMYAILAASLKGEPQPSQAQEAASDGPSVLDTVAAVVRLLEDWTPGNFGDSFNEQTQGAKPPQVYVRSVDKVFHRYCESGLYGFPPLEVLPNRRLLSYDNLARLTRAALDIPDVIPEYPNRKTFNAEDVRRALEHPAE